MTFDEILNLIVAKAVDYAPKVILAIVVFYVGFALANWLSRWLVAQMEKKGINETIRPFVGSIVRVMAKLIVVVSVISMLGVEMTSLVALIGAAGLAVGLALQGSLSNFAGGVLLAVFQPMRVGEYIEAQGVAGTVDNISIFHTTLKTPDNKVVIVPNGPLANGNVVNYSREATRRVDLVFGISYGDDIDKAKATFAALLENEARVMKNPEPVVKVLSLGDSSVNFAVRGWVKKEDYWDVFFALNEGGKKALDGAGISIPFPQMDVHMQK